MNKYAPWVSFLVLATAAASCDVSSGSDGDDVDPPGTSEPELPDLATDGCGVGLIASGLFNPSLLALAGDQVIVVTRDWSDDRYEAAPGIGDVFRVPLDGSSAPTLLASGLGKVNDVATDGTTVFFSAYGQPLLQVPVSGGAVTGVPGVPETTRALQVIDGSLYFETWAPYDGAHFDSRIAKLDLTTGAVSDVVLPTGGATEVGNFTTNGSDLFYTRITSVPYQLSNFELVRRYLVTGDEEVLLAGTDLNLGGMVATPDRFIYLTIHGSGPSISLIHEHHLDYDVPDDVFIADDFAVTVTASDTSTYWGASKHGTPSINSIRRRDRQWGDSDNIPADAFFIEPIACPGGVCWADRDEGTVKRFVECDDGR